MYMLLQKDKVHKCKICFDFPFSHKLYKKLPSCVLRFVHMTDVIDNVYFKLNLRYVPTVTKVNYPANLPFLSNKEKCI